MKEKIKNFFANEKTKMFFKKVFNKKTIISAVVVLVLIVGLHVTYSLMFKIEGVVRKVDGNNITVVNFLRTQTVNTGDYKIDSSQILVGDRVEIMKNISGDIIEIRDESEGHGKGDFRKGGYELKQGGNGSNNGIQNGAGNGERGKRK